VVSATHGRRALVSTPMLKVGVYCRYHGPLGTILFMMAVSYPAVTLTRAREFTIRPPPKHVQ
jgi:hypothetical protein